MKALGASLILALAATAVAQTGDKTQVFTATQLHQQLRQLESLAKTKGSSGAALGDYGTHAIKLSERTTSGGAEVHAHYDDLIFVTAGEAQLITGGTVIDSHLDPDGETKGSGIQGGRTQSIASGSLVHIPAGTPHQMIIPRGVLFQAVVIKVHEP